MSTVTVTCFTMTLLSVYACDNATPLVQSEAAAVVAQSSADLTGRVVSIRGPIGNVFDGRAFAMEAKERESEAGLDRPKMLVLANAPITISSRGLADADEVIVRGKLWKFDRGALHEQLGWNPLFLEEDFDGEPVVIAESVTMAREPTDFWNEPYQAQRPPGAATRSKSHRPDAGSQPPIDHKAPGLGARAAEGDTCEATVTRLATRP